MNPASATHLPLPFVSVLIPVLNEEKYIDACLDSVLGCGYPADRFEIVIADGGSADRTAELVRSRIGARPRIRLVENPQRLQSAGLNRAAAIADDRAEYLLRLDAHSRYPAGFISACVAVGQETGAELVVYVNEPRGVTPLQKAIAFAFTHPAGIGDSLYRRGNFSGWVDHGQHGLFRRGFFAKVGGYDESLSHNEDSELSHRVLQAGGRIYLDARLRMQYSPRTSLGRLARQYFAYGVGRAKNVRKHRQFPKLRQVAPPLWLVLQILCIAAAILFPAALLLPSLYGAAILLVAISGAVQRRAPELLLVAPVLTVMHQAWAAGFLKGFFMWKRS